MIIHLNETCMALLAFMTRRFLKFGNVFALPYRLLLEMGMTYHLKQLDFSTLGCVVLNLIKIGPVVLKKASKKSLLHSSVEIYYSFLRRLFKVFIDNIFPLFKNLNPSTQSCLV